MIIICNGGYRTGSTLTFNICIKTAELNCEKVLSMGMNKEPLIEFIKNHDLKEYWVIKSHDFICLEEYNPNIKIVHSCRHPLQAAASNLLLDKENKIYNEKILIDRIVSQKDFLLKLKNRKDTLILNYKLLVNNLPKAIKKTTAFLDFPVVKQNIENIANDLSRENVKKFCDNLEIDADSRTQFRKNHIKNFNYNINYWKDILPENLITMIASEVGLDYINYFDKISKSN